MPKTLSKQPKHTPKARGPILDDLDVLRRVTRRLAVAALEIPEGTFAMLMAKRVLPLGPEKGVHDLLKLWPAYVAYLDVDRAQTKDAKGPLAEAKLRLVEAQADNEELAADEKAGALIPYAFAESILSATITTLRAELEGTAGRLAHDLAAETAPAMVRRRLLDDIRAACDRAACKIAELSAPVLPPPGPSGDAGDTAAEAVPGRLGGNGTHAHDGGGERDDAI